MTGSTLPALRRSFARWALLPDGPVLHTVSGCVQPVIYAGKAAMLKIAPSAEEQRGGQLMIWWGGRGAVRVLAQAGSALLLERACGPGSLVDMVHAGRDDEASRIMCEVLARLHGLGEKSLNSASSMPQIPLISLSQWFQSLFCTASQHGGIFQEASSMAASLLAHPQGQTILHGDMHHGNVLDAGPRGWIAIDPKGLMGERGFDFANMFCNPDFQTVTAAGRFMRQVAVVCQAGQLERKRLLQWITVWAALSATWFMEDNASPDSPLAVAHMALAALGAKQL